MLSWRCLGVLIAVSLLGLPGPSRGADTAFPFGAELMLDVEPLYGSKRIPMIEIEDDGTATIDLWCASVHASATVGESSMTIVADQPEPAQCTPERETGDQDLLSALSQVTSWRRNGEVVELIGGPTTLRFREMTN
jgi:META domain-containing protein